MISSIFVKKLNKKGLYVSDVISEINNHEVSPFRIAVNPISNEIKYRRVKGGYIVSGEGFVFNDDSYSLKKHRETYLNPFNPNIPIKHTEVSTLEELF